MRLVSFREERMIRSFKVIKNIGVFKSYEKGKPHQVDEFGKKNVIFGLNTYGKSTLCDILKDINDDNCIRIKERLTIPHTSDLQTAVIDCDGRPISLNGTGWANNSLKNRILVFDTEFVVNNVFDGNEIAKERDTKENFTEFILGENGVAKTKAIEKLKAETRDKKEKLKLVIPTSHKEKTDSEIKKYVIEKAVSYDEYSKCKAEHLELTKRQELLFQRKKRIVEIQNLKQFAYYEDLSVGFKKHFESVRDILAKTYALSESSLENYKKHLDKHFNNERDGEKWLSNGIALDKSATECPFCGQNVNSSTMIPIYKELFDESYTTYVKTINDALSKESISWDVFKLHKTLSSICIELTNTNVISGNAFDDETEALKLFLGEIEKIENELSKKLEIQKQQFIDKTNIKKSYPTISIPLTFDEIGDIFNCYICYISQANEIIKNINGKIDELKRQTTEDQIKTEIEELEKQCDSLNKIITRYDENDQCNKWKTLSDEIDQDTANTKKLTDELDDEQKKYLDDYFESINYYFRIFGGRNYKIQRTIGKKGMKPVYTIEVLFHDEPINKKINHVFSESDKRALALSVFFSKISNLKAEDQSDTIVVLDDPITSFDNNRITSVINETEKIAESVSQIFVFGHHLPFIDSIHQIYKTNYSFYELSHEDSNSYLVMLDKEMNFSNLVVKTYLEMKNFVDFGKGEVTKNTMRIFLEEYLKVVFADYYKEYNLGDSKFSVCIDELAKHGAISEDTKKELHNFRNSLNPESHVLSANNIEDDRTLAGQILSYIFTNIKM